MSDSWKQYEGRIINNTFPLEQFLSGSEQSAVFLTRLSGPHSAKAAIKLIPEGSLSDLQLSLWRRAMKVTHPNVLRLHQGGRCRLGPLDLLYVVTEYAEEDLSQILPQRPLTASEARDMLGPVLKGLEYLHGQGLVHSHLKPSNVLANGDQVKLSSDTLFPAGEYRKSFRKRDIYEAPESANLPLTPACDVWSLGVTLVETLTQHAPEWSPTGQAAALVPETLPQPFLDIATHALQKDPKLRWTLAEIGASLNPRAAAAAAHGMSPLSVPLSPVAAVPAAKLEAPKPARPVAKASSPQPTTAGAAKQTVTLPNYVIPLAVAVLVLGTIVVLPRILGQRAKPSTSASEPASTSVPSAARVNRAESKDSPARQQASESAKRDSSSAVPESSEVAVGSQVAKDISSAPPESPSASSSASVSPDPASLRSETPPVVDAPKHSGAHSPRGEILDQVLPEASEKALATIHGRVHVGVLVHIDEAGNVSEAELSSPGPSQYFGDLALKAARRWEFTSPEVDGHSVPSAWQILFVFTTDGVKVYPSQTAP
jgi:TonB family protein